MIATKKVELSRSSKFYSSRPFESERYMSDVLLNIASVSAGADTSRTVALNERLIGNARAINAFTFFARRIFY